MQTGPSLPSGTLGRLVPRTEVLFFVPCLVKEVCGMEACRASSDRRWMRWFEFQLGASPQVPSQVIR